ncbi:hypothetical protein T484DRAFT_1787062 [Baffinella frigidus]|nr:hypothetical protein T484DRAFT_1787062 [Cryptophyta sp. CCMP2293]
MVFSKLLFKKEKRKEEEEEAPPPDVRGFTAWTQRFHLADRRSEGALSFDDFRRTVRSANVKASVISDVDLKSVVMIDDPFVDGSGKIDLEKFLMENARSLGMSYRRSVVTIVDADGSGKIDLEEFLTFLRPDFIPDMKARERGLS